MLLLSISGFGQHDLSGSRQMSALSYVFRISDKEALRLFLSDMKKIDERYLYSLVDSFPAGRESQEGLQPGNYLWVTAVGNGLQISLRTVGDLQYDLINNSYGLAVSLHTKKGEVIDGAVANIDGKRIPYDPQTQTYRIDKRTQEGSIKVIYRGVIYFFPVTKKTYRNPYGHAYSRWKLLNGVNKLYVSKQGALPVYITAYQQFWNRFPEKVSGDFTVRSFFVGNGQPVNFLKTGQETFLKADVSLIREAEYILIEIPIPAGCSYKDKDQDYYNNEVHREYFKNKVSIFCRSLGMGKHTFTVSLLPRYTGRYQLNPAKAELMYFPVFYGREGMKKLDIK